jgi:cobaltochelatase CobN
MPHGHAGAAEIARALDSLHGFATTMPHRFDRQFDLIFDATLGTPDVEKFLVHANPAAHAAMRDRFRAALADDLWRPQRNSVAHTLVTSS